MSDRKTTVYKNRLLRHLNALDYNAAGERVVCGYSQSRDTKYEVTQYENSPDTTFFAIFGDGGRQVIEGHEVGADVVWEQPTGG